MHDTLQTMCAWHTFDEILDSIGEVNTGMKISVITGDCQKVKDFLAAGANPNAADRNGRTPLHEAAVYGREAIVPVLLAAGANPNVADRYGGTPLHSAAYYGREATVQLLLTAGAEPNVVNQYGSTPLHYAASYCDETIVSLLLAAGANPTTKNKSGKTPSQLAKATGLLGILVDAEYVWSHEWTDYEHARWPEAQRLERVGALSVFRRLNNELGSLPPIPLELQFKVFAFMG